MASPVWLYSGVSAAAELYLYDYCAKIGLTREEILYRVPVIAGARLSESVGMEEEERLVGILERSISK